MENGKVMGERRKEKGERKNWKFDTVLR